MSDALVHTIRPGEGLTECCGKVPSELPRDDRVTSIPEHLSFPDDVLCTGGPRPTPAEIRMAVDRAYKLSPKVPNPFDARPVVDREALIEALQSELERQGADEFYRVGAFAADLADAVLALLPTEGPVALVHCGDMEQHVVSFNQGYAEAQRQGIGGPESRVWVTEKIETVLGPLTSLRPDLAVLIADQLLTETDMRPPGPVCCSNCEGDTFVCAACGVAYDANS